MQIAESKFTLRFDSLNTRGKGVKITLADKITIENVKSVAVGWVNQSNISMAEYLVLINPHEDNLVVEHMEIGVGTPFKDPKTNKWLIIPEEENSKFIFKPKIRVSPFYGWNNIMIGDNTEMVISGTNTYNTRLSEKSTMKVGYHAKCLIDPLNVSFEKLDIHLQAHSRISTTIDCMPFNIHKTRIRAERYSSLNNCVVLKLLDVVYYKPGSELNISIQESKTEYNILATKKEEKSGRLVVKKFNKDFFPQPDEPELIFNQTSNNNNNNVPYHSMVNRRTRENRVLSLMSAFGINPNTPNHMDLFRSVIHPRNRTSNVLENSFFDRGGSPPVNWETQTNSIDSERTTSNNSTSTTTTAAAAASSRLTRNNRNRARFSPYSWNSNNDDNTTTTTTNTTAATTNNTNPKKSVFETSSEFTVPKEDHKERDVEDLNEDVRCVVCLTRKKQTVIFPCLHNILCVRCSRAYLIRPPDERKCPSCRKKMDRIIKIYQ